MARQYAGGVERGSGASAARVTPDDAALDAFVAEVGRFDSPVQNTRRFVASRTTIEGVSVEAGDAILVVLAAANRDPAVHRDPQRFILAARPGRISASARGRMVARASGSRGR